MKPNVIARTDRLTEAEFQELRRTFIGASDAAAIIGANKFSSALEVYLQKKGLVEPKEETHAMYWGKKLENEVALEFARRNGVRVTRMNTILAHPLHPFIAATPDRKVMWEGAPAVLECKTSLNPRAQKYWDEAEHGVPLMYLIQVQQQLYVTGWKRGFIAALLAGPDYREYEVVRDDKLITAMVELEVEFWKLVANSTPPASDGATLDLAKALYPTSTPTKRAIYGEASHIFDLVAMKRLAAALERGVEQLQARIILETKDADTILVPGIDQPVATYKDVWSDRWDTKALEADHPELVPDYKKPTVARRFNPQYKTLEQHPALMAYAQKKLGLVLGDPVLEIESKE